MDEWGICHREGLQASFWGSMDYELDQHLSYTNRKFWHSLEETKTIFYLLIEACRLVAINVVPPIAGELFLTENSSVGAQKRCSLFSLTPIVTDMISLTPCFYVRVHSRHSWYMSTREGSVGYFVVNWIVVARYARNFMQILLFLFVMWFEHWSIHRLWLIEWLVML